MEEKKRRRNQNRTIVVDFQTESLYEQVCQDGKKFIERIVTFIVSAGLHLCHRQGCCEEKGLTRHSHYHRVRLNNLVIWRVECMECGAVFTVLPHFVLRYSSLPPEVAKKALLATHGGLSLENCHLLLAVSVMCIFRLVCALGKGGIVLPLAKCGLKLPAYFVADEKHSYCLTSKVYLPTIVVGRVIWHMGYTQTKNAGDFAHSYGIFKQQAEEIAPDYEPKAALTDGFESTRKSLLTIFPKIKLGNCLMHATKKVPSKLQQTATQTRQSLAGQFYRIFSQVPKLTLIPVFEVGQRLRHFVERVKKLTGDQNAERIKQWIDEKKQGWYTLLQDKKIPKTSTCLDQAHNYLDRKLFDMKGFHHPSGNQREFISGLALLYNIVPYQRRAKNSGRCGIEVNGGKLPTKDWFLNLRIITSGGYT